MNLKVKMEIEDSFNETLLQGKFIKNSLVSNEQSIYFKIPPNKKTTPAKAKVVSDYLVLVVEKRVWLLA